MANILQWTVAAGVGIPDGTGTDGIPDGAQ
ncbi:hypothetical protein J2S42_006830 [Catenuloplanes indicus]|uniref:Uncharacterized protein n=1 Tax=Catenuloplanes indicus TaxID=137267 RepID=A0AAE3W5W3_9ACTN|nr:hypothetical protein [Catenuloplanes indicus]